MKTIDKLLNKSQVKENNNYSFIPEFEQIIKSQLSNYGTTKKGLKSFFEDMQKGGCISGMIGAFSYHADTKAFYIKHIDDLESYIDDIQDGLGEPIPNKNEIIHYTFVVWVTFEEYCYDLYNTIFEA
jgi:uncharacterized protein Yka (UPF0111/DUF47 family)